MALVAAFAVSGYSSAFWRTHKPFNPLLGETYECLREDKGFRYIAEQVGKSWAELNINYYYFIVRYLLGLFCSSFIIYFYSGVASPTCVSCSCGRPWVDVLGEKTCKWEPNLLTACDSAYLCYVLCRKKLSQKLSFGGNQWRSNHSVKFT